MNVYFIMDCLVVQELLVVLKWILRIVIEYVEIDKGFLVWLDYELLVLVVILKVFVNENRDNVQIDDGKFIIIGEEEFEMKYLGKGFVLFEGEVVYVEM